MGGNEYIKKIFKEHQVTTLNTLENCLPQIENSVKVITKTLKNGSTVFWCGNGGSASDSQHLAAELVGRFKKDRRPLRSIALTTDTSVLTAISNDYSYEEIFSRQIEGLSKPNDLLITISTSGNSRNIINSLIKSKELRVNTIAILGKTGGKAKELSDNSIIVPSDITTRIQEVQILLGHTIIELVEKELGFA